MCVLFTSETQVVFCRSSDAFRFANITNFLGISELCFLYGKMSLYSFCF